MPFSAFISYLELEKKFSPHTVKAYKSDLIRFNEFVIEEFDSIPVKEVNYPIIRNWIVSLVDQQISNRSINRKISSLKTYFKFLQKTKQIDVNPLLKHKALKTSKKIQVPFSEKEIDEVLLFLNEEGDFEGVRNKLIVELFYSTGIRRSELVNLKLNDVYLTQDQIKVL